MCGADMGQEIDVWVRGRTRVRLRVVSLNPQTKANALLFTTNTQSSHRAQTAQLHLQSPQPPLSKYTIRLAFNAPASAPANTFRAAPHLPARRRRGQHRVHSSGAARAVTSKATFHTLISFTSFDTPAPS
ncbi:hypothetical protein FIBSPDRAFT_571279 [Athelia psychrophila]|uniref:Uncharacterized protein n=1 Tax=Athelia psychrophila TaxID=1759441 RepID=A0A166HT44_9AGAM|nr:hypothetical protein FIBSPDRAFT_571279 [Fibularhizoctonia sp. CBS 109695]